MIVLLFNHWLSALGTYITLLNSLYYTLVVWVSAEDEVPCFFIPVMKSSTFFVVYFYKNSRFVHQCCNCQHHSYNQQTQMPNSSPVSFVTHACHNGKSKTVYIRVAVTRAIWQHGANQHH